MRLLAIGDIHGCLTALDTLLALVKVKPLDQVVFVGDYIDRGPNSKGVLDRLITLRITGQVTCLRGNHEQMMLAAQLDYDNMRFWLACGGTEAMESYLGEGERPTMGAIPDRHWHFLKHSCVDWYETEGHIFVHANLHPSTPLEKQTSEWLHWEFLNPHLHVPHQSGKTMICGHSEQRDGVPLQLERAIGIDTWAYGDGWLTCLDVLTGDYWQANDFGQTRTGRL